MKNILTILIMLCALFTFAQTKSNVSKDASGNYTAKSSTKSPVKDRLAIDEKTSKPKTYTDSKGKIYPVYLSVNDKEYVVRTASSGNTYKYYIKYDKI